jgi:N-acetylglucosaminyl-diphospho-decaprenol L-rhamnosyltransferase
LAVAAVIVTYNSESVIEACLEALAKMAPGVTPIVVDNASQDQTLAHTQHAQVIANSTNRGFAAAVNQGLESLEWDFALLLNPDVEILTSLDSLIDGARQYGLSAGKLVDQTGSAQRGFTYRAFPTFASLAFEILGINRLWPGNPVNRKYRCLDADLDQPAFVEQPAGAFLMLRRDVWDQLHGLDPRFHPVWFEDVDFCRRAVTAGYRIRYVPQVQAFHHGGHSVTRLKRGCRDLYWYASLLKYAAKYLSPWEYRGICLTILVSALPRMGFGIARERSFSPANVWVEVVRLALKR